MYSAKCIKKKCKIHKEPSNMLLKKGEKMFDVFISYKCLNEQGYPTEDYRIAKQLYKSLTEIGIKCFFSEDSLSCVGNANFKQEIDNALDSVKIMIVVLTKADYALSKWVKYEWDSYYNDYLSGVRDVSYLYTFCKGISNIDLPRTLRMQQSFNVDNELPNLIKYVKTVLSLDKMKHFRIKNSKEVTFKDIQEAVELDYLAFPGMEHVEPIECWEWFNFNSDIYLFVEDTKTKKIVAYTNTAPITEECYERIKTGTFLTTDITNDMILSYEMPYSYSLYFFSIVIHPDYRDTDIFYTLINGLVDKFVKLVDRGIYLKRMIADAVTINGERFCSLFGMKKVVDSLHNSKLYEIEMIPPKFKIISKKIKQLYDCYERVYNEAPYLFDDK